MSALPVDPTSEQLNKLINDALDAGPSLPPSQIVFQAGVEAERARAAAETTEEHWVKYDTPEDKAAGNPTTRRRLVGPWEVQS